MFKSKITYSGETSCFLLILVGRGVSFEDVGVVPIQGPRPNVISGSEIDYFTNKYNQNCKMSKQAHNIFFKW